MAKTNHVNYKNIANPHKYNFRENMIIENRLGRIVEVHLLQHVYQTDNTELTICENYVKELLALELGEHVQCMTEKDLKDAWEGFRRYLVMNPGLYDVKYHADRFDIIIKRAPSQVRYRESEWAQVRRA